MCSTHRRRYWAYRCAHALIAGISRQVKTSQFLCAVVELLLDYIRKNNDRSSKVLDFHHPTTASPSVSWDFQFHHPQTLKEMMAHCLDIPDDPQSIEQILSDCKETLKYCVKTGSLVHLMVFVSISTRLAFTVIHSNSLSIYLCMSVRRFLPRQTAASAGQFAAACVA